MHEFDSSAHLFPALCSLVTTLRIPELYAAVIVLDASARSTAYVLSLNKKAPSSEASLPKLGIPVDSLEWLCVALL